MNVFIVALKVSRPEVNTAVRIDGIITDTVCISNQEAGFNAEAAIEVMDRILNKMS